MADFPNGFEVIWDEQSYRPVGIRPHLTKLGKLVDLIVWESDCPICGKSFEASTMLTVSLPFGRRRCDDCKAPGKRVRKQLKKLRHEAGAEP